MVAYSFRARFAEPILAGTKLQTIRADRKRHARPGEELQLYTGMRTKQCKLIARRTCLDVLRTTLLLDERQFAIHGPPQRISTYLETIRQRGSDLEDAFARADGFANWSDLRDFWAAEHPGIAMFEGPLIRWAP